MATVFITLLLFVRFQVYKMDGDCEEKRSVRSSQREKRWSMNSQRLEEIVAELMKPISDLRRSFDTDLSALLEEYLTEAGLYALDAGEGSEVEEDPASAVTPNFAELALLLQQSACIYGRKVDFLYQHVLSVSDSLQTSTQEISNSNPEEPQTPTTSKRKRKNTVSDGFGDIELSACEAARREGGLPRPPPTLPRMYIELEPRVMTDSDVPLMDYNGEPIGLLSDFHVTWRLQGGYLVDELEGSGTTDTSALRPIPLLELQAAIEAAAPPSPPPHPHELSPPPDIVHLSSTPLPPEQLDSKLEMPPPNKKERKRKSDVKIDQVFEGSTKILLSKALVRRMRRWQEFTVSSEWVSCVVAGRASRLLRLRRAANAELRARAATGFSGWSATELEESCAYAEATTLALAARLNAGAGADTQLGVGTRESSDSDDDGFFEQSSLGDSDGSRVEDSMPSTAPSLTSSVELSSELMSWRAGVVARAAAEEARPALDVRQLATTLLRHLAPPPHHKPFSQVLASAVTHHTDVSRLFLATLFLANAGNVEVRPGPALSLDSFSVRLVSTDERLYRAAAADEQFLR